MTQIPGGSPGRWPAVPADGHAARTGPGFRGKAWLLLCLPVGLTTFAAFGYIGIRARRPRWLACGGFSSIDDLGVVLDLPATTVDALRPLTVFVKD